MTIAIIVVKTRHGPETCDMRVSKEQAAENRERMLETASRLLRERGIAGVGVDALTAAAGMTHGSLYSQFGSKERLVEEAVAYAIAAKGQELPEVFALRDYVSAYLSAEHRDGPGSGCPLAALCCEMPRQSQGVWRLRRAAPSGRARLAFLRDRNTCCCICEPVRPGRDAPLPVSLVPLRCGSKQTPTSRVDLRTRSSGA